MGATGFEYWEHLSVRFPGYGRRVYIVEKDSLPGKNEVLVEFESVFQFSLRISSTLVLL